MDSFSPSVPLPSDGLTLRSQAPPGSDSGREIISGTVEREGQRERERERTAVHGLTLVELFCCSYGGPIWQPLHF